MTTEQRNSQELLKKLAKVLKETTKGKDNFHKGIKNFNNAIYLLDSIQIDFEKKKNFEYVLDDVVGSVDRAEAQVESAKEEALKLITALLAVNKKLNAVLLADEYMGKD